jgi:two-component system, OmpR family, response regulator
MLDMTSVSTRPRNIAVVDDDPRIRDLLTAELEDLGFSVTTFADAFDFLAALPDSTFDLILLDILLPQVDGIECLRRLRLLSPLSRVVVFSALSDSHMRSQAESLGSIGFVLKPDFFEDPAGILQSFFEP